MNVTVRVDAVVYFKVEDPVRAIVGVRLNETAVSEVKNVAYQAYPRQLKDALAYARKHDLRFDLYVRPTTRLSMPLRRAIANNLINLRYIP